ncbi:hypothetical protein EXIGLDRAFT_564336, partial [Exidia glandulosa HHB12029]
LWSGPLSRSRRSSDAEALLALMAQYDLQLALPPATITHESGSTLDLVLVTSDLADAVTSCGTSFGHGSDHEAVDLALDLVVARADPEPRPMWREVSWDDFIDTARRCVPVAKPSPFSKRWWTRELSDMRHKLKRLLRRARKRRATETEKEEARIFCRAYHKEIRRTKRDHWRDWLEE